MSTTAFFCWYVMKLEANDIAELRPVITAVVQAVLSELEGRQAKMDRIAYSEAEAASLLGVARHVLRDCRLRGEIQARKVGKEFRYHRSELERFAQGK